MSRRRRRSQFQPSQLVHTSRAEQCELCTPKCREMGHKLFISCPCPGHITKKIVEGVFQATNALTR